MVRRIAPIAVVSIVLLAACGVLGQNTSKSFPDAPSVRVAAQGQGSNVFAGKESGLGFAGTTAGGYGAIREEDFSAPEKLSHPEDPGAIFRKYLYPSSQKQKSADHYSESESLMGRAVYAASGTFVTRDESGKGKLNTAYFLRALTSVIADTASRPYWRRSVGQPFSNFGSTMGNDAGMNLWHEFRPGIEQLMKSHTPKFVARIEERVGR
jgi:hypothetical protein